MQTEEAVLSDEEFMAQFEAKTLDPTHFNHLGHLRIAWLYLTTFETEVAIDRICNGIKAYAESLGAKDKFHWTMTDAISRIMARRIDAMDEKKWQPFLQQNADLVEDFQSVLLAHYSEALLYSDAAKVSLVNPDIKSI